GGLEGSAWDVEGSPRDVEGRLRDVEGRLRRIEGRLRDIEGALRDIDGGLWDVERRLSDVNGSSLGFDYLFNIGFWRRSRICGCRGRFCQFPGTRNFSYRRLLEIKLSRCHRWVLVDRAGCLRLLH